MPLVLFDVSASSSPFNHLFDLSYRKALASSLNNALLMNNRNIVTSTYTLEYLLKLIRYKVSEQVDMLYLYLLLEEHHPPTAPTIYNTCHSEQGNVCSIRCYMYTRSIGTK